MDYFIYETSHEKCHIRASFFSIFSYMRVYVCKKKSSCAGVNRVHGSSSIIIGQWHHIKLLLSLAIQIKFNLYGFYDSDTRDEVCHKIYI